MSRLGHANTSPPGGGYSPENIDVEVTAQGAAFSVGDLVQFDILGTDAATTSVYPNQPAGTSIYNNVVAPTTAGIECGPVAIVMEAIADGAVGKVRLAGIVPAAFIIASTGTVIVGAPLVAAVSKNLDFVHATGERIVARVLVVGADSTPTTRTGDHVVEFNGITGFGGGVT